MVSAIAMGAARTHCSLAMPSAKEDTRIDKVIDESFPASDPPSWTLGGKPQGQAQVQPPIGSLSSPLPSEHLGAPARTWDLSALGERLDREGPVWAAGVGALGAMALFLAGKRRPASWLIQASTFLLLFATHRELARRRT